MPVLSFIESSFLGLAVLLLVVASPASAILGTMMTIRRIGGMVGALAHAIVAGIGISFFLQAKNIYTLGTNLAAGIAGIIFAFGIMWMAEYFPERLDSLLNVIWAVGMALGLLFVKLSPAYADILSYLFGNILLINKSAVLSLLVLDLLIIIGILIPLQHHQLQAFDRSFARIRGLKVKLLDFILFSLIVFYIVIMSSAIGVLLILALLAIPPAAASLYCYTLKSSIYFSLVFNLVGSMLGLLLSFIFDLPSSSIIVLCFGFLYVLALLLHLWQIKA